MPEALIALGGNVGDVRRTFRKAIEIFCDGEEVWLRKRSSDYRTPPWGVTDQPPFINAAIEVATGLPPRPLLERAQAVERIFGRLPAARSAHLLALWNEFEEAATPDARFAQAIDRAMPALLNLANDGQSWRENGISYERVVARVGLPIEVGCPALWDYLQSRLEEARGKGWFGA